MCAMFGRFPWEPPERTGWFWDIMGWKPPIKVRWVGSDWEKHIKGVLEAKIHELWPKSRARKTRVNKSGVEAFNIDVETGSTLELMSNNSDVSTFEGANSHLVIYDEPPARDVRVACARGLVDYEGREVFAMTLLDEPWIEEEVLNQEDEEGNPDLSVYSIEANYRVNLGFGISQKGIDQFSKSLNDEERMARLEGKPLYKRGIILNINRQTHIIDRFPIPSHWPVDVSIDIHPAKPQHILFMATDENNFKYVCHEIVDHGDGSWIADEIVKKAKMYNLRINRVIIDPLAKADSNNAETTYDKIYTGLARFGYTLETASKEKQDGIISINSRLHSRNGIASLFFFKDMRVAIKQALKWRYDETEKPSKKDDDQCENLYRLTLLDTHYSEFEDKDAIRKRLEYNRIAYTKNNVTGY